MLKYSDIFVPGGFPRHTYNPREALQLERKLAESKENLCKLTIVTGQTKSGKTVLAKQVFPTEESIWIDGGFVSTEDDFWQIIIEQLNLFQTKENVSSRGTNTKIGSKATAQADFVLAKGTGEASFEIGTNRDSSITNSQTLSSRIVALNGLKKAPCPVVIDDFHYIPRDTQGCIIHALKRLIFDGLPVIIIAIPHRRYDAVKVEKEMTGRFFPINIPTWTKDELKFIPEEGFRLLNCHLPSDFCESLADQAIGSPHLMQEFCREISKRFHLGQTIRTTNLSINNDDLQSIFRDVAETIGRTIFEKLARGPRQRTDRTPRILKNGNTVDIYQLILHAMAHISPDFVSLEYEQIRAAIKEVSDSSLKMNQVVSVLKQMAKIAATDQTSTPVIDFEEEEKRLHITDPFFAFYLRWGELVKN